MIQRETIQYDFFENDKIWPPGLAPASFTKALMEVLSRLPDDDYYEVSSDICFVVEHPDISALNVPFNRDYPPSKNGIKVRIDTVVIFHPCLEYPHAALVGLLAHEIAHSFVSGKDYGADEEVADDQVRKWGFADELQALDAEHAKAKAAAQEKSKESKQA